MITTWSWPWPNSSNCDGVYLEVIHQLQPSLNGMFRSCKISTDKCVARFLCNDRTSCYLWKKVFFSNFNLERMESSTFWSWPQLQCACRGRAIEYSCTKFTADSSSHFPFRVRTHTQRQTHKVADATGQPTRASAMRGWLPYSPHSTTPTSTPTRPTRLHILTSDTRDFLK